MNRLRDLLIDGVHLFALTNVFVAQPLYDLLARTVEFFVARRSEPIDVFSLVAGLSVLVPAGFLVIEGLAEAIGPRFRRGLHCFVVGALVAIGLSPPLKAFGNLPEAALVLAAVAIGTSAGLLYGRYKPFRSSFSLGVIALAGLVFPANFLLNSPALAVLSPHKIPDFGSPDFEAVTPVVMVVFDEFPVTSLMNEEGLIDPIRYPHFAALAKDAHWYRAATTRSGDTLRSVPAILSGLAPGRKRPHPTTTNYPHTLFTLLGGAYELEVFESLTQICPKELCEERPRQKTWRRLHGLFQDLSLVYLHMIGPSSLTARLPAVTQTWKSFAEAGQPSEEDEPSESEVFDSAPKHEKFEIFLESIDSTDEPTLYFLHSVLPHVPWRYLPSGKRYSKINIPGLNIKQEIWGDDEWLVLQGYQRHLLQVGFVDRLVGDLIERLKAQDMYDRSLIVLTADHGVNFQAGTTRRGLLKDFPREIQGVPLFVKEPYQERGATSDLEVETIDIMPAIADILDVPVPWPVDGRSFYQETDAPSGFDPSAYPPLQTKLATFGSGLRPGGLFRIGRYRELVGRDLGSVEIVGEAAVSVVVDQVKSLAKLNLESTHLPCQITGRITGEIEEGSRHFLAISVHGTIQAVTRTYWVAGKSHFRAMIPESSLRPGQNVLEVFVVSEDSGRLVLRRGRHQRARTYALHMTGKAVVGGPGGVGSGRGSGALVASDGRLIPLVADAMAGSVKALIREGSSDMRFSGWALDVENKEEVERVVMFADERFVRSERTRTRRPNVVKRYGAARSLQVGFRWDVPAAALEAGDLSRIRFFGVSKHGFASEIDYRGITR